MSEVARRCLKCYGRPPLRDTILLPDQAQLPGRKYLDWHTQAAGPGRHVITRQRDRVLAAPTARQYIGHASSGQEAAGQRANPARSALMTP